MHSQPKATKGQAKKSTANSMPYCAVPKGLLRDPELIPTDKVVAALILPWLKKKPSGYVLNSVLARQANLDPRSVPRSLNRLEATGWFQVDRGPTLEGHRRITALWRTSDGLKAILERLARLGVDIGDDKHVRERMTSMSPKPHRANARDKQRIQLESEFSSQSHEECCAPSLSSDPVVSEVDEDQVLIRSRREMARLARSLGTMSEDDADARDVVDQFADASLDVVWDTKASRRYHCKVGLALIRRQLSVAGLLGVIDAFAAKFDGCELHNEPGWYVSKVDPMILPEPDESAAN